VALRWLTRLARRNSFRNFTRFGMRGMVEPSQSELAEVLAR